MRISLPDKSGLKRICLVLLPVFYGLFVSAQSFNFRTFSTEQGLPDRFVYTIQSDPGGFLWLGTGAGLSRFDGKEFYSDLLADTLNKSFVTSGYLDRSGRIWFGFNDGHVVRFSGLGAPRYYPVRSVSTSTINGFAEDPYGNVLVASQNGGVLRIRPGDQTSIENLDIDVTGITAIVVDTAGHLLIGTFDGLYIYKFFNSTDSPALLEKVNVLSDVRIQVLYLDTLENEILAGTSGQGVYRIIPADNQPAVVKSFSDSLDLSDINIQDVLRDVQGNLWVATFGHGVLKLEKTRGSYRMFRYDETNGLTSRNVKRVFEDFEHNIWFGTFGDGLVQLQSEALQFISLPEPHPGNNVKDLIVTRNKLIAGTDNGVFIRDLVNGTDLIIDRRNGLPVDEVTSVCLSDNGDLWAGTSKNGVFLISNPYRKAVPLFVSANDLERKINDIKATDHYIWSATSNGIFQFDKKGKRLNQFTTSDGLPYNKINEILPDSNDYVWITSTSDALYRVSSDGEVTRALIIPNMGARNEFLSICRDRNGNIWAGTYGNGLFYFTGDTVLNYSTMSGLLSNYCYSVAEDPNGDIWIGHRSGISRLDNSNNFIQTYTARDGISGDVNQGATFLGPDGKLWFGTTQGIITYDVKSELPTNIPPRTTILSVTLSDQNYPVTSKLVLPYGKYRLRIDFIGISYSNPEAVRYQYILNNYDQNWSDLTSNSFAYYSRIEDGRYTFQLKAYNAFGISNPEPVTMQIIVKRPFWKAWWFYLLVTILVITTVVVIIKIRERNHIKLQKYLQSELEKRTREVVRQKEELEIKNKEITDSINYAKRIQASILPPIQRLKETFPESFVYYLPRDIVSGDFYWWGKIDEERFLVVCADSTGHGVPGAFMSMIGSTLIKDATNQHRYETPSQLLSYLDKEITTALNQNLEAERSNDGMDIVVCEINPTTRHLKFASAMRPIILFHQNEQFYIRGNRSAVGGEVFGEKVFDDQEYHLNSGDIIYLFSDGYPDQFGGPKGKKFKMVRLKNLIDDIHDLSMNEQWLQVKTNFEAWKGDYEQVDDVLFMGIRIL